MKPSAGRHALYYPFHLCHERALERLLTEYGSVHFRDYMALRLTPLSGTTAYADRMGDRHADLVRTGRIVQGYAVSGPLDPELIEAVNRDLADAAWRIEFHDALREDRRFQRGLFDLSHAMTIAGAAVPGPAALLALLGDDRKRRAYTVGGISTLSGRRPSLPEGYEYEYGLALLKTSAALAWTIRLCRRHGLEAVTDSPPNFRLLERTLARDGLVLTNRVMARRDY